MEEPKDDKELKKLLKTRNNVLLMIVNKKTANKDLQKTLQQVAETIVGKGTIALVDCRCAPPPPPNN